MKIGCTEVKDKRKIFNSAKKKKKTVNKETEN